MEQSMTYVLFHSRFQLSKKRKRAGDDGKKEKVGGGGAEASLPLFLLPIVPHALFFFSFSLSSPHPTLRAFQFLQLEKQSTVNDKWRTFFIVSYASVMTPCDGITQVSAVV